MPGQLKLRLKDHLHAEIKSAAALNRVSMNREIVDRLARSFRDDEVVQKLDQIINLCTANSLRLRNDANQPMREIG